MRWTLYTNSASCLNKKQPSQALCILQYIFKLENVSMRIKNQVTMTLIHVFWIKWTTLFMQAHLIFKWSVIWYIEICMSSTCFYIMDTFSSLNIYWRMHRAWLGCFLFKQEALLVYKVHLDFTRLFSIVISNHPLHIIFFDI
jgi:hypothetical protein